MGFNGTIKTKILFILIFVILASMFYGCSKNKEKAVENIKNVKLETVDMSSISTEVEYAGKLKPLQQVNISPKSAGKVTDVKVDEGDRVKKGQVLFVLDSKELYAQLEQQQANLGVSEANLEKTKSSTYEQQVLQAEQSVQNGQISFDDAKEKYEINQQLYTSDAISLQVLNDSYKLYQSAAIQLKAAQDNLALLKQRSGPESAKVASAQVDQAAAGVNYISEQINNSTITAPISGTISSRNVNVGEIATTSANTFTIIDTSEMIAEISVTDRTVSNIKKGQKVQVKINSMDSKVFEGIVDFVSPAADTKTQAYKVKIRLKNSKDELKSGMLAKVSLTVGEDKNALKIPNGAIKYENGVAYVYTVENNTIKKIIVTTGLQNDEFTEIKSGLKAGDKFITEGQTFLDEGERVNAVE